MHWRLVFCLNLVLGCFYGPKVGAQEDLCKGKSELTLFMKLTKNILLSVTGKDLGRNEISVAIRHPLDALRVKSLTSWATIHSNLFCGANVKSNKSHQVDLDGLITNNETDAIRHFILAAMLAYYLPKTAYDFLTYHEVTGERPVLMSELMDLYNNRLGMEFGEGLLLKEPKISEAEIAVRALQQAVELMQAGKLRVVQPTVDQFCHDLRNRKPGEISEYMKKHLEDFPRVKAQCEKNKIHERHCGLRQ